MATRNRGPAILPTLRVLLLTIRWIPRKHRSMREPNTRRIEGFLTFLPTRHVISPSDIGPDAVNKPPQVPRDFDQIKHLLSRAVCSCACSEGSRNHCGVEDGRGAFKSQFKKTELMVFSRGGLELLHDESLMAPLPPARPWYLSRLLLTSWIDHGTESPGIHEFRRFFQAIAGRKTAAELSRFLAASALKSASS